MEEFTIPDAGARFHLPGGAVLEIPDVFELMEFYRQELWEKHGKPKTDEEWEAKKAPMYKDFFDHLEQKHNVKLSAGVRAGLWVAIQAAEKKTGQSFRTAFEAPPSSLTSTASPSSGSADPSD